MRHHKHQAVSGLRSSAESHYRPELFSSLLVWHLREQSIADKCQYCFTRCFDSPTISPMDVKIGYTNSSAPSFERILVESTINASMFRSTGTVCCEASSNGDRSSAFFNFAIKGSVHKMSVVFGSFWKRILSDFAIGKFTVLWLST